MDHDHQRVSIFFLIMFLEVSKKKSGDLKKKKKRLQKSGRQKMWNSGLEGKS